jgi:membrane-associated phospholipid phosphatase
MGKTFVLVCALALATGAASAAAAQGFERGDGWTALRWWHPIAAGAGVGALFLVDEPLAEFIQNHRSQGVDDFGTVMAGFSDDWVIRVIGGELIAAGLIAKNHSVASTGLRVVAGHIIGGGLVRGGKWMFGRGRPSDDIDDAFAFDLFDGTDGNSFPSGAAVQAFAFATTLADEIDHPVASIALYSAAGLNAWSRLNSNRHWASDVALGGIVGMTLAKLMNGEWRLFGLRPPEFWAGPRGAELGWNFRF